MRDINLSRFGVVSMVAALALSAVAAADELQSGGADSQALARQAREIVRLQAEVEALRTSSPDWAGVAAQLEPSVITVTTDEDLGSGWVVRSDRSGSDIVTNYHVVAQAVEKGENDIQVTQFDRTMSAAILRTDPLDDLALLRVSETLAPLATAALRPRVGTPVLDLGSPLGLKGTVSAGVVSAYRSIFGSDYLQFTAPISPGNSGGPVVDGSGRVVGIATGKIVDDGADALYFAIPVQVLCSGLVQCVQA